MPWQAWLSWLDVPRKAPNHFWSIPCQGTCPGLGLDPCMQKVVYGYSPLTSMFLFLFPSGFLSLKIFFLMKQLKCMMCAQNSGWHIVKYE